ncbi:MAG TPA: FAD-binding oxidoreductase [Paracoccaceae bacterium]|nr:FAD-binding oxidoreductase [Paracoccaceae bacterium]
MQDPSADSLAELARIAGERYVLCGADADAYLAEPRDLVRGRAALVLRPDSTDTIAAIVRHCAAHRIGIVPWGGGTGLVGGQVAPAETSGGALPVVLSLERMNRVRAVVPDENAMIVEAGVILQDVQAAAAEAGRLFPLSLAAQGSCRIGGNLSTNAGGVQVLRYGNARDLCLGLEAVLPDGSVLHGLKTLRKDNTGYDLRHLLIGAEGTLGIITAAALKLYPRPGATVTAMLAVPGPAEAVSLLRHLQERLGDNVTAFELINGIGVGFLRGWLDFTDPLPGDPPWRVLTEITGPAGSGLEARAEAAMADAFERGLATDGVVASSEAQRAAMWSIREHLPEGNRRTGSVSSHDISLPIGRIAEFLDKADDRIHAIERTLRVNSFGHMGDGNLHCNVFPAEGRRARDYDNIRASVRETVHDLVHELGGSISAEHGIGRFKTADLVKYGDPAKLSAMRAIKAALDPHGIMNPGAVLG